MKQIVSLFVLSALSMFACNLSFGQGFPNRPIRLVVPAGAGGMPDTVSRVVAQHMTESLGQPIVIENRPSAGGIQGTEVVLNAPADGYTLLQTDAGLLAINPHLYAKLSYDPLKDLVPVSLMTTSPLFMVVHTSYPANTVQDLIARAKANPGKIFYGSPGAASIVDIMMAAFEAGAGVEFVHVHYKGTAGTIPALLGGQVQVVLSSLPAIVGLVDTGKLKQLATTSLKRSPAAPNVPSIAEAGIADYDFTADIGLSARAGTPAAIISRLSAEVAKAVKHPDTVRRAAAFGAEVVGSTPEAYAVMIRADYERFGKVVRATGVKAN